MKVYVAEEAGFCFGVKRALDIINELHEKGHRIQIYGQLIHNSSVLHNLNKKGIHCIDSFDQIDPKKTIVIRTHGIPQEIEENLKKRNINFIDATCPLVKKLQEVIGRLSKNLSTPETGVIIIGDKNHPEIIAAQSYCPEAMVINSVGEALELSSYKHLYVVQQTTLDADFFDEMISYLDRKAKHLHVYNTICNATKVRQKAIKSLASRVEGIIVVGGKNSSNTRKLFNIAQKRNNNTFHIEKSSDLLKPQLKEKLVTFSSVGITAGASTPPDEINKVENFLVNLSSNIEKEMYHGRSQRKAECGHKYQCE